MKPQLFLQLLTLSCCCCCCRCAGLVVFAACRWLFPAPPRPLKALPAVCVICALAAAALCSLLPVCGRAACMHFWIEGARHMLPWHGHADCVYRRVVRHEQMQCKRSLPLLSTNCVERLVRVGVPRHSTEPWVMRQASLNSLLSSPCCALSFAAAAAAAAVATAMRILALRARGGHTCSAQTATLGCRLFQRMAATIATWDIHVCNSAHA